MKMRAMMMAAAVAVLGVAGMGWAAEPAVATVPAATEPANSLLKDQKGKISYIFGMQIGMQMKREGLEVEPDAVAAGIKDTLGGKQPALTKEEMNEAMTVFQKEMTAKVAKERAEQEKVDAEVGAANLKEGEAFLAANAKKEGVKTTASGLQYKVIKSGSGKTPKASDTVSVHYRGTLLNGKEFDSSLGEEPRSFPVDRVIPGWTEALQLMKEGDKWQVWIPAKLAYKDRSAGDVIGPNSTLVFEMELLSVKAGEDKAPAKEGK